LSKIVLISCVSEKLSHKSKAKDLYVSKLFQGNFNYARLLNPDKIFVLSAKYGLVDLEMEIEPYDKTLNNISSKERREWADDVLAQIKEEADLEKDEFIFLAGEKYREYYCLTYQIIRSL
jgi:hypothetical protein